MHSIPVDAEEHLKVKVVGKCVEKWSNLLIDFRLAGDRSQETGQQAASSEQAFRRRESVDVEPRPAYAAERNGRKITVNYG